MKNKIILFISIIFMIMIGVVVYLSNYYKPTSDAKNYLKSNTVIVKSEKDGYFFDGPGKNKIFVFYPGGKVDEVSYAPIMNKLAKKGIDTYIVKFPFNIAFFKVNAISKIMKSYDYNNWYIGGHSLGGVVAAMDTKKNNVQGLVLMGSYSTSKVNCKVLSIYGSNDGVLNLKKYKENKKNIPNSKEVVINGGNHSNFGNYGTQKGDNKSAISRSSQQEQTIMEIYKFIE